MAVESSASGWVLESWCASLSQVLESLTGAPTQVSHREVPPDTAGVETLPPADVLWWEQPLSLEGQPVVCVGTPAAAWRQIGERVLRASGLDNATEQDWRSTFLEVLRQTLAGLAASLGNRLGRDVRCEGGTRFREDRPPGGLRRSR